MKVVINADDFGKDLHTNDTICYCFKNNLITNTSIMTNTNHFNDAVAKSKEYAFFDDVGFHLNFLTGKALTENIKKIKIFCDPDGSFNAKFVKKKNKFFISNKTRKAIQEECLAQATKYIDAGFSLMHFDSHGHTHTIPFIYFSIKNVLKKCGFISARATIYNPNGNFLINLYKKMFYKKLKKDFKCLEVTLFTELNIYPTNYKFIEIMVHPIYIEEVIQKTDYDKLLDITNRWEHTSFSDITIFQ